MGVLSYTGGVPTSLNNSGQQWDFPNAWPPLQWFAIVGMINVNNSAIRELSFNLTSRWIQTNWKGWIETASMYEKVTQKVFCSVLLYNVLHVLV
jgi:alpha,alpha-trehalase